METKIFPLSKKTSSREPMQKEDSENPAEREAEYQIDLNEQLIKNKKDSCLMRVHSNAMMDAGIQYGDVLVVTVLAGTQR